MVKTLTNKQILTAASVVAVVILLLNTLNIIWFLEKLELNHFSDRQRAYHSNRTQGDIIIVGLGQDTTGNADVQKIFGKYPYPRDFSAYIVRFFNRTRPKMVIMDTAFELGSDLENPEKDQMLADAIEAAPYRVATGIMVHERDLSDENHAFFKKHQAHYKGPIDRMAVVRYPNINLPYEKLIDSGAEFYPAYTLQFDAIHLVRTTFPFVQFGEEHEYFFPNLPLAPLLDGSRTIEIMDNRDIKVGQYYINTYGEQAPIIRWYGNIRGHEQNPQQWPPVYKRYEMWDVVRSELILECDDNPRLPICQKFDPAASKGTTVSPHEFSDHYILTGITIENTDVHPSIYGTNYPGLYFQANIMDNFLHNDFIRRAGSFNTYVACAVLLLATGLLCSMRSVWTGLILIALLGGAYTLATYYAYDNWGVWLNWIYPISTMALCTFATLTYRLITTQSKRDQLEAETVTDPLTNLYNKRHFNRILSKQFEGAKALRTYLALIFIDIDHFKSLNDQYGHQFGDQVLITAAAMIKEIAHQHHVLDVCRYGGEEVTIIVPNTKPEEVEALAEEICQQLRTLRFMEYPEVRVSASFGVSTVHFLADERHNQMTLDEFVDMADKEVYRAKAEGRDRVCSIRLGGDDG